jgi:hypothetical protein
VLVGRILTGQPLPKEVTGCDQWRGANVSALCALSSDGGDTEQHSSGREYCQCNKSKTSLFFSAAPNRSQVLKANVRKNSPQF